MSDEPPVGLFCPICGQRAAVVVSAEQAFCGNDDCVTLSWNPTMTREQLQAQRYDIGSILREPYDR